MTSIKECPICIEIIRVNGYVVTECGHYFCLNCFIEHIQRNNKKCPMCREIIVNNNNIMQPNVIEENDDDTPILDYMSDVESNISSGDQTPRLSDISDDESDDSNDIDNMERNVRIRSR